MRIGKVIGRITLNGCYGPLCGGKFLVVEVQDRFSLAGQARKTSETVVAYDILGAGAGEMVAFTESREATMPFYPEKKMPLDALVAAILDQVRVDPNIINNGAVSG